MCKIMIFCQNINLVKKDVITPKLQTKKLPLYVCLVILFLFIILLPILLIGFYIYNIVQYKNQYESIILNGTLDINDVNIGILFIQEHEKTEIKWYNFTDNKKYLLIRVHALNNNITNMLCKNPYCTTKASIVGVDKQSDVTSYIHSKLDSDPRWKILSSIILSRFSCGVFRQSDFVDKCIMVKSSQTSKIRSNVDFRVQCFIFCVALVFIINIIVVKNILNYFKVIIPNIKYYIVMLPLLLCYVLLCRIVSIFHFLMRVIESKISYNMYVMLIELLKRFLLICLVFLLYRIVIKNTCQHLSWLNWFIAFSPLCFLLLIQILMCILCLFGFECSIVKFNIVVNKGSLINDQSPVCSLFKNGEQQRKEIHDFMLQNITNK